MSHMPRRREQRTLQTPLTAIHRRARIAAALGLAACVALLGRLVQPSPLTLSPRITGDAALAARVRASLTGPLDRVSVAMVDGDTVTYAHFGADAGTEYEIGSITKTFTALLLADAISRGEVTADTRVGTLLPLAGSAVADVTLAELASHRSGLPRQGRRIRDVLQIDLRYLTNRDPYVQDAAGIVAQARAATLHTRGTFSYSNLGMALLGQALAAASGLDYAQLVQERIFGPLGMTASSVPTVAANLRADASTGYSVDGRPAAPWTMSGAAPAGGIRSTPADLVRYAQALLRGTAPGLAALTPRWQAGSARREIGYGWVVETIDGHAVTWHTGATGGFTSMLALDRASGRAVVLLVNRADVAVRDAAMRLLVGEHP